MKKLEYLNLKWSEFHDVVLKVNELVEAINEIIDKMEVVS